MAELRYTADGLVDMGSVADDPVDDALDLGADLAGVPAELTARWDDLVAAAATTDAYDDLVPEVEADELVGDGDGDGDAGLDDDGVLDEDRDPVDDAEEPVLEDDDQVLDDPDDDLDDLTDDDTDIDLL